jgi:hypothetical protein
MAGSIKPLFEMKIRPRFQFNFELKDLQASMVNSVLEKKHCVGVFPTEYGKSMFLVTPLNFGY